MKRARLRAFIEAVTAIQAEQTDEQALTHIGFFPEWKQKPWAVGDRCQDEGILYKCIQAHDATPQPTWRPKDTPNLWTRVDDPSIEWPAWVQPTGSTDAYMKNAKVSHNGHHWMSDIDYNPYEPGVYGWTMVE